MTETMSATEAVARLRDLDWSNPEDAHITADNILLALVPEEVRDAYKDLVALSDWWAFA